MNTVSIIGLVLTSSVLAAGISSLVSWRISTLNYKREYYKKLIDRRLAAFDEVEKVVADLNTFVQRQDGTLCPFMCLGGPIRWDAFRFKLFSAQENRLWLGKKTSSSLTDLNVFVIDFDSEVTGNSAPQNALEVLGAANASRFREFKYRLHDAINEDLREMTDISSFLKKNEPKEAADFRPEAILKHGRA
ncbi:MAG: hypothetical protein WA937_07975 [Flavobacteriales bacterium]